MLHLFICVFILEKYTLLKSLALVILHHNHSLLTRYDFLPFMYCLVVPKNLGFPKNQKNQKNKKTIFQRFLHLGLLQKRVLKYCFCFFYFLFFGNPRFFGTTKFPNLWKIVFLNTQNIWSYLKCLYLLQKLQKNICKSLSLSGAKFPEKTSANRWKTALPGTPVLFFNICTKHIFITVWID